MKNVLSATLTASFLLDQLHSLADENGRSGMTRFGINTDAALGISMATLRTIAKSTAANAKAISKEMLKEVSKETSKQEGLRHRALLHAMALDLWESGIHEARILAILLDNASAMTEEQIESWVRDVNSWDICDQLCSNLLCKNKYAQSRIDSWCENNAEFVRRVGIVMIAASAVHNKKSLDEDFMRFFPLLEQYAFDERNFVKKAVNWSLRQLGKRSAFLLQEAKASAERIKSQGTRSAKWIAADALREFDKLPEDYFSRKKTSPKRLLRIA